VRGVGPAGLAGLEGAAAALRAEGSLLVDEALEKGESVAAGVKGRLAAVLAIDVPSVAAAVALKGFYMQDGN
jgi:hypothetical protein